MPTITSSVNLSSVSYTQGELFTITNGATLTINSTPALRPGSMVCITSGKIRIENVSTTTPIVFNLNDMENDYRIEGNGIFEIRGAPISLGTGTGSAQTFNFGTIFTGVPYFEPTYVEVETSAGSGDYMPWMIVHEDPKYNLNIGALCLTGGATPAAFAPGECGEVFFWHETNRTLRTDATTTVVGAGRDIRIPNIYLSNRLLPNQTSLHSVFSTGVPTGGTFTLSIYRENGTLLGTSNAIPFNATAAQVDAAIEAVTGAGTVTSAGGPIPTAVTVTWAGIYATERLGLQINTNSLTGGTNSVPALGETATSLTLMDLSPAGTFDAEWASFSNKIYFTTNAFASFRAINCGFGGSAFALSANNGSVTLDGFHQTSGPYVTGASGSIDAIFGETRLKRIVRAVKSTAICFTFSNLPALVEATRIKGVSFTFERTAATGSSIVFQTMPINSKFIDICGIGQPLRFTNIVGSTISNYRYADRSRAIQTVIQPVSAVACANVTDTIFAQYTDAGVTSPRSAIFTFDAASSNITVTGGVSDGGNNTFALLQTNSNNIRADNFSISNVRSGPFIDLPATFLSNSVEGRKLFATFATAQATAGFDACQNARYDLVPSSIAGINEVFAGVNNFVGGNFVQTDSITPTAGHVTFGPVGASIGADTSLVLTGAAFTDQLGALVMPTAGDTAVLTMPFAMHGITGFANQNARIYADTIGGCANVHFITAPGIPTGGTYTLTVTNAAGTVLGTTTALAFNASATTLDTAIEAIPGIGTGQVTIAGTAFASVAGFTITFGGTLANTGLFLSINGANLTGGSEPGVAYAYARSRLFVDSEFFGAGFAEFAMRVPGTAWPSYAALTGANLQTAFAALTGYSAGGSGLEMRLRLTCSATTSLLQTTYNTRINQISLETTVDPSLWFVGNSNATFVGPAPTDIVEIRFDSDDSLLTSFTGAGFKQFSITSAQFDKPIYFVRKTSGGTTLFSTKTTPIQSKYGAYGSIELEAIVIKSTENLPLSTFVIKNGTPLGWVSQTVERVVLAQPGDTFSIYAIAYGHQAKVFSVTGNDPADFNLTLIPDPYVDTTRSTVTRNAIAATISSGVDISSRIFIAINQTLAQYDTADVLHGLHWYLFTSGQNIAAAAATVGEVKVFFRQSGIVVASPAFYGKVNDSVTSTGDLGILAPIYVQVEPSVYVADPTYTPVEKNTSNIVLGTAPWPLLEAEIPNWVATEATANAAKIAAQNTFAVSV